MLESFTEYTSVVLCMPRLYVRSAMKSRSTVKTIKANTWSFTGKNTMPSHTVRLAPYRLRGGNAPWFICWFQRYI